MGYQLLNALTIDVEDWAQAYLDYNFPVAAEVLNNTKRLMGILDEFGVKGTFFCLGVVAREYPSLIRQIAEEGHEIGVHGWIHRPLWETNPVELRQDLTSAKDTIEQSAGVQVRGFRAPRFSIIESTSWALDVIGEVGFQYDSSIVPGLIPGRRYGISGTPLHPHESDSGILEVPLTSLRVLNWQLPAGGGGYMRFLPLAAHRRAIQALNESGYPAVVYIHPH